jgi:hypothetical protein
MPGGNGKGAPAHPREIRTKSANEKGRPSHDGRPFRIALPAGGAQSTYDEIFILSVATATRFEIGCANSPNIFSIRSVEREPSAIIVSNAVRA